MRAAVLHDTGGVPRLEDFAEPEPADGAVVADVLAAGLNSVDLLIAAGRMPLARREPPYVAGLEGVVRTPDGARAYAGSAVMPHGMLAERTLVAEEGLFALPEGVGETTAVALGISGLAAWLGLSWRAKLREGETALVLGATGTSGMIGVQAARLLGAGRVVAAGRDPDALDRARRRGADAVVRFGETGDDAGALREASGGGVDVTIDLVWGAPAAAALAVAREGARHVQIGNAASPEATLPANPWRTNLVEILGYSTLRVPLDDQRAAYQAMAAHAAEGRIAVECETVALADVEGAWRRQVQGPGTKLVVRP